MPDIDLESLPLVLAPFVPGFVSPRVHQYLQLEPAEGDDSWFKCLALSAINFAFWFWLIAYLWRPTREAMAGAGDLDAWRLVAWVRVILISPAILGVLTGFAHRESWLRDQRIACGVAIPSPVGRAWGHVFGHLAAQDPLWCTVTLTDGSIVEGYFADKSFASSKPSERDLFLEQQFVTHDGRSTAVPDSAGVWVAPGNIKAIEFKRVRTKRA